MRSEFHLSLRFLLFRPTIVVAHAGSGSSVVTTNAYDSMNRVTSRIYSFVPNPSTPEAPPVTYCYDGNASGSCAAAPDPGVAPEATGTVYLTGDHLGSTRLVTSAANTLVNGVSPGAAGSVVRCYDYMPFGEDIESGVGSRGSCYPSGLYPATPDVLSVKFTGKERDAESGLDFFGARYTSSAQGRFTSADPLGGHREDPQTLNRYTYARNDPLRFTDPTGLDFYLTCADQSESCQKVNNSNGSLVQGQYVTQADGSQTFSATQLQNDPNGGSGFVDQKGNQYSGSFDQGGVHFSSAAGGDPMNATFARGTDPTVVAGASLFQGFTGVFHYCPANDDLAPAKSFCG
jgi:RHS repeat-associated protein